MDRIVVVVDGATEHDRALQWAATHAGHLAPCTVTAVAVCATEPVLSTAPREPFFAWNPYPGEPTEPPAWTRDQQQGVDARHHAAREHLDRTLDRLTVPGGVTIEARVMDHPHHADAVTRMAIDAAVVVIDADVAGAGGGVEPERLAHHLLRHSTTPLVLVP